jgi:hypothetical protein
MKKIIAISMLTVSLAATSAFAQGYFTFQTGKSQAWDGFTTSGVSTLGATVDTSFLWEAGTVASPMPIAQSPITGTSQTTAASVGYTAAQAWNAILTGGFTIAQNAGNANATVVQLTAANGGIAYNGGVSFGVTGTSPSTTYSLFLISWNSAFATPQLAAAAGAAVGWSSVFQQASLTSIGTGPNFTGLAPQFGTFIPAVPEPATIALAGLGGLSLLALRRKK